EVAQPLVTVPEPKKLKITIRKKKQPRVEEDTLSATSAFFPNAYKEPEVVPQLLPEILEEVPVPEEAQPQQIN
ncbi:hypothetical protein, partial [Serratia marcescens]|uniref:hypothetical protein n=1 Tax=Serratia marcescens TaxID=615 RepID=UPI0028148DC6